MKKLNVFFLLLGSFVVLLSSCSEKVISAAILPLETALGTVDTAYSVAGIQKKKRNTMLHRLCFQKNADKSLAIKSLSKMPNAVHAVNDYNETPLHVAVNYNQPLEIIQILVDAGSKLNAEDEKGNTPLHLAILSKNSLGVLNYLLEKGASVDSQNQQKDTPIHLAISSNQELETISRILKYSKSPNLKNNRGFSPLLLAIQSNSNPKVVSKILDLGLEVIPNYEDLDTLVNALEKSPRKNVFLELLNKHLVSEDFNNQLLNKAIEKNDSEITDFLLKSEKPSSFFKGHSHEFLMHAIKHNSESCVSSLIHFGASVNGVSSEAERPLPVALKNKKYHAARILLQHGATFKECNVVPGLLANIAKGCEVDPDTRANTYVYHKNGVNVYGDSEFFDALLAAGYSNLEEKNAIGETALHIVSKKGDLRKVNKLLEAGAQIDCFDEFGNTPLHISCRDGSESVARLLINQGADINAKNLFGDTPLFCAILARQLSLVVLLVESGSDLGIKNYQGISITQRAAQVKDDKIMNYLMSLRS